MDGGRQGNNQILNTRRANGAVFIKGAMQDGAFGIHHCRRVHIGLRSALGVLVQAPGFFQPFAQIGAAHLAAQFRLKRFTRAVNAIAQPCRQNFLALLDFIGNQLVSFRQDSHSPPLRRFFAASSSASIPPSVRKASKTQAA